MKRRAGALILGLLAVILVGCGGDDAPAEGATTTEGVRVVSPTEGAAIQSAPPAGLVILDVRTTEEFDEGHLEGAVMIDFYGDDFADRIGELDPDVPYLVYCRSGNRSGQTRAMMEELGFSDVADVDGGIVAWTGAGLPVSSG